MMKTSTKPAYTRLKELRDRTGLSQDKFAKRIGLAGASSYQRYEQDNPKARSNYLKPDLIERLMGVVGMGFPPITREDVLALGTPILPELLVPLPNASTPVALPESEGKIGVFGRAVGGREGSFEMNGTPIEYVQTPPYLQGVTDAYGVYIIGSSMEPRYFAGELVYIHPHKPCRPGNFVVVQLRPEQDGDAPLAFVKQYVRETSTHLVLKQYNPERELAPIPLDKVVSIHRIVGASHE